MFPKLMRAYKEHNFPMHCGNNKCLCAAIAHPDGTDARTGGGISITDVAFFFGLSTIFKPEKILVIGNASGYGSFCLAEVFTNSKIDVIDAEIEGDFNHIGSQLTRNISNEYYNNQVNLMIGFCPEQLDELIHDKYDLIFLDSLHTDEQQLKDYNGLIKFASDKCVMYLHDVGLCNTQASYEEIKNNKDGVSFYDVDFSTFGCKAGVRNLPIVEGWLKIIQISPHIEHQNPTPTLTFGVKCAEPAEIE